MAYADCGTGGALDRVLEQHGVERLAGAHCYGFFAGNQAFEEMHEEEPGTYYLTDFLARHFDALVIRGMKLDRYPEAVNALTVEQVNAVIKKHLDPGQMVLIKAGTVETAPKP